MNRGQVAALWRTTFQDSEAFIRLFFLHFYRRRQTFSISCKGQVVSALQVLPYEMTTSPGEPPLRLAYIVGCCTDPRHRGKGYMGQLLERALSESHRQGFDVAALIPASPSLFAYYGKSGFSTSCFFSQRTYHLDRQVEEVPSCRFVRLKAHTATRFYPFFARCLRQRSFSMLHNGLQFRAAVADAYLDQGGVYGLLQQDYLKPLAMAFVTPSPPVIAAQAGTSSPSSSPYIKELVSTSASAEQTLLNRILALYHSSSALCRIAPPATLCRHSPPLPYGMSLALSKRFAGVASPSLYLNLMLD
ncbi:MAG: GNAT family N-acetyltransferase [Tannerellaceae bacterium]|jgi:predicted GNAT family N-acyltransferase|nr:GNAT family N-acetyltransferase [Tannerellaceae bacterium]